MRTRLAALTALTLFLTFDLIVFGSFTRLSDSGLGCPDWPGCYGEASPLGARDDIHAAQSAAPGGPVTWSKAWIEMIHRYLAMTVGALILVMAAASWVARRRLPVSPWWPTFTLVWVLVQGLFGKYTVTLKLYPAIVTLHLLGGLLLLVLLARQHAAFRQQPLSLPPAMRRLAWVGAGVLTVQLALGGWVSTNYAVLACTGFPQCNGAWWPAMDWAHGFDLLRHLGEGQSGGYLTLEALVAVHMAHRLFALVVAAVVAILAWRLWCLGNPVSRRFALGLALLLALQIATGLSNVVLDWPIVAALLHSAGAAFFVLLLTLLWARSRLNAPPLVAAGGLTGVGSLESPIRI
jgi:cytochrome c oxidase assembly protein subunit 15